MFSHLEERQAALGIESFAINMTSLEEVFFRVRISGGNMAQDEVERQWRELGWADSAFYTHSVTFLSSAC